MQTIQIMCSLHKAVGRISKIPARLALTISQSPRSPSGQHRSYVRLCALTETTKVLSHYVLTTCSLAGGE